MGGYENGVVQNPVPVGKVLGKFGFGATGELGADEVGVSMLTNWPTPECAGVWNVYGEAL